ncbi:hypothetical protein E2C01_094684 [Portunus trituberculatus]|uniref:Uncharacterized protein n=1 Tax=Portunus trituberculatus TaxID=210409 RepID=A0A5B7JWS9_PORTR|nr:hypothetical protein [Portunus trituberculatus]
MDRVPSWCGEAAILLALLLVRGLPPAPQPLSPSAPVLFTQCAPHPRLQPFEPPHHLSPP